MQEQERFTLFPLQYPQIWEMYKKAVASFWAAEEIDLSRDKEDFDSLDPETQRWIELVLAQFSQADAIVSENIVQNFSQEVQPLEAKFWFSMQTTIENIHTECYSMLIDTYIQDNRRKAELLHAIVHYPSVKQKADWCFKYMRPDRKTFAERLVAFACCEMIFFSSSFCAIFYIKKMGKLPGLCFSNELISRDEATHCQFGCLLFSLLHVRPETQTIHAIIRDAVDTEHAFVREAVPPRSRSRMVGMSSEQMCRYVEFVADFLCQMLQIPKIYDTPNPFDWMQMQSMTSFGKVNFFECRNSNYRLPLRQPDDVTTDSSFLELSAVEF